MDEIIVIVECDSLDREKTLLKFCSYSRMYIETNLLSVNAFRVMV